MLSQSHSRCALIEYSESLFSRKILRFGLPLEALFWYLSVWSFQYLVLNDRISHFLPHPPTLFTRLVFSLKFNGTSPFFAMRDWQQTRLVLDYNDFIMLSKLYSLEFKMCLLQNSFWWPSHTLVLLLVKLEEVLLKLEALLHYFC